MKDEDIFIPQSSIRFQLYQNIEQTKIDEQISDFITWAARKEKKEFRREIAKAVAGFTQVVKNAYLNEAGIQI